jgi:hypothetical protein
MVQPYTFSPALPQTGTFHVLDIRSSTVFASPNLGITCQDPTGTLATSLTLVPDHIAAVSFIATDASHEYRFQNATLVMREIGTDGTLKMMWATTPDDYQRLPLVQWASAEAGGV